MSTGYVEIKENKGCDYCHHGLHHTGLVVGGKSCTEPVANKNPNCLCSRLHKNLNHCGKRCGERYMKRRSMNVREWIAENSLEDLKEDLNDHYGAAISNLTKGDFNAVALLSLVSFRTFFLQHVRITNSKHEQYLIKLFSGLLNNQSLNYAVKHRHHERSVIEYYENMMENRHVHVHNHNHNHNHHNHHNHNHNHHNHHNNHNRNDFRNNHERRHHGHGHQNAHYPSCTRITQDCVRYCECGACQCKNCKTMVECGCKDCNCDSCMGEKVKLEKQVKNAKFLGFMGLIIAGILCIFSVGAGIGVGIFILIVAFCYGSSASQRLADTKANAQAQADQKDLASLEKYNKDIIKVEAQEYH